MVVNNITLSGEVELDCSQYREPEAESSTTTERNSVANDPAIGFGTPIVVAEYGGTDITFWTIEGYQADAVSQPYVPLTQLSPSICKEHGFQTADMTLDIRTSFLLPQQPMVAFQLLIPKAVYVESSPLINRDQQLVITENLARPSKVNISAEVGGRLVNMTWVPLDDGD